MSRSLDIAFNAIEQANESEDGLTRRRLVTGTAATLGGMGLLGLAGNAEKAMAANDPQTILNVAATAEVRGRPWTPTRSRSATSSRRLVRS